MKKLFFAMMIVSSYFLLPSCSKPSSDATPANTDLVVSFTVTANSVNVANNGVVFVDDSIVVTVNCTGNASNTLTNLKITCTDLTFNLSSGPFETALTGTSAVKSAPRWGAQGDGPVTFTATVTGSSGNPVVQTFTVNVMQIISGLQTLGNQKEAANNQLYSSTVINSTVGTATFGLSDVAAVPGLDTAIDFAYCTKTSLYYLVSPDDTIATRIYGAEWPNANEKITNWSKRNKTRFIQIVNITSQQFDKAVTNSEMLALLNIAKAGGEPNLSSVSIVTTQIYLFKTEAGKYGLMKIISPDQSWDPSTGTTLPGTVQLQIDYFN